MTPHRPHPRESAHRCALRAQLRGDPHARHRLSGRAGAARRATRTVGTSRAARIALRPRGPLAAGAARVGRRACGCWPSAGPGRTPRGMRRRWALADTPRRSDRRCAGARYGADAELLELPLDGSAGEPDDAPLYLVCAHSKHDACCALRGRPVAAALEPSSARDGCGSAATSAASGSPPTCSCCRAGLLYGRVLPFAAAEFVAATEAGEVVGALLRGRIGLAAGGPGRAGLRLRAPRAAPPRRSARARRVAGRRRRRRTCGWPGRTASST